MFLKIVLAVCRRFPSADTGRDRRLCLLSPLPIRERRLQLACSVVSQEWEIEMKRILAAVLMLLVAPITTMAQTSEQEAYDIGIEAYAYFYPLISMEITRQVVTNVPPGVKSGMGPMNAFHHMRAYPTAEFRQVVRPNFDTLYSSAWLDLSDGPLIVSAPDTAGRYYLMPMLDMWSDVFASPGSRTSGTGAGHWAVVPPGWTGKLPEGVQRIESPTVFVWVIARTQTNGPKDYAAVGKLQDGYTITPLVDWGKEAKPVKFVPDATIDMKTPPMVQVEAMPAAKFFRLAAEVMKKNPPHLSDWSQVARLKRIGIEPGKSFEYDKLPVAVQKSLERVVSDGQKLMKERQRMLAQIVNGWQMNVDSIGVYGNNYLKRAIVAQIAIGANQPEDAIYPLLLFDADKEPLKGENTYVIHFEKNDIPPVNAFWSITMYDEQGFPVANSLNRFAIGDRDELKFKPDGSLDILIQSESPGKDLESNWLPSAKAGVLGITMRMYAPRSEALTGAWKPPVVRKVR